jgi:hypothetical protein
VSTSYRITLRCTDCGHKFRRTVASIDAEDPPCPRCAKVPENIGLDVAAGQAPAIGGNPVNRAMDYTMEAVATDYGFTDLSTDAREGATMTPKLPPAQQAAADAMFNPKLRGAVMGQQGPRLGAIAANAMAGGYKMPNVDPIARLHASQPQGTRVKANFVAGDGL